MTMQRNVARGAAVALALAGLLAGAPGEAQVATGTIAGSVKDEQGAAVPGANVTITEVNKGTVGTYTTDADGSFQAPFLIPGTYEVAVELTGFRKYTHRGVVLQVNQRARVDATLAVGGLTEATEVVGLAPLTRTDSAELGEVIEERAVRELPLNGRNFAQLVYLVPGITPGQAGENLSGASTFNPRGASNFNALGSQANTNAWLVDGIDNNEYTFNTVIVQPTVESVREFKVLTGTFSAEFGRGAGVVSVSTKSGQNAWHGTAFEYLRNEKFDAKNFFALPTAPKAPLDRHQFGAPLSGPIIKNKTFFFVDYAGQKEERGQVFVNTVPTAATRRGDFSDYRDRNGNLIVIYDPLTTRPNPNGSGVIRDPFPGNIIPANRIDPVGRNVASIYPLPNGPGNFDNYTSTVNRSVRDHSFTGRIDHRAGSRDNFFARFSYEKYKLDAPQGQAACCLPTPDDAAAAFDLGPFVAGIQNTRLTTMGGAASWTHLFGPNVVNELRLGFAKTNPETRQSDYGHQSSTSLGIQGINVSDYTTGLPNLNIQDITGISGGPAFLPVNPKQLHYQVEDTLSWVKARHTFKTGYRFLLRKPTPFTHTNTRSSISVNRNLTNNPQTNSQGSGISTLLLGYTTGGSRGFLLDFYEMTNSEHSAFIQDDWKASERLTINAGLRYEVYVPDTEAQDRLPNYDPVALELVYAGENADRHANKQTRWGNFAPRIGAAFDVTGDAKNVLRAGYGRSFFPVPYAAGNLLDQNVPDSISQNYSVETNPLDFSPSRVPRLSNPFPPIVPVKPQGTAALNAANPLVFGHAFSNETPHMDTWQLSYERQLTNTLMAEVAYAGQQGIEPHLGRQHQRGPAGAGHAGLAAAHPAPLQRGHDQLLRHQQPLDLPRPAGEGEPALRARPAVPGQLHVRQVPRLRRLARLGRRRRGRAAERHPLRAEQGALGVRRQAPLRAELGLGAALRSGPRARALRAAQADPPGLAVRRHRDAVHRPAVHRLPQHRRQQRRALVAGPDRRRPARQPDRRSVVRPDRLRGAGPQQLRDLGPRRALRPGHADGGRDAVTHVPDQPLPRPVPGRRLQPLQHPPVRVPEPEHRLADGRPDHHDHSATTARCSSR